MSTATESAVAVGQSPYRSADELLEVLDLVMRAVDTDADAGPRIRAAKAPKRIEVPDLGVVLNMAASFDETHCLRWAFSDDIDWTPKLEMTLDSEVANSYFQGRENLAIALLRGRIRTSCDSRTALRYFPAASSIFEQYRNVIERGFKHLVLP